MNPSPLISIITPTYNHEKFIADCIESVLKQTFTNWEMIILNDGSTDQTAPIVEKYAQQDNRISLINQENVGIFRLSETYNKGLSMSHGEFIAILEGDDCWISNKLEKQLQAFSENRSAILCWSQAQCVNFDKTDIYYHSPLLTDTSRQYFNNDPVGSIMNIFLFRNCIPALTILIRKEALLKIEGFKQNFGLPTIDLPTLYELSQVGKFCFIPEPLGYWRMYITQTTKTYPVKLTEGFQKLALSYLNKYSELEVCTKLDINKIKKYYKEQLIIAYARSGRYRLIRKEFKAARIEYLNAIQIFGFKKPIWKLRALIGLIFSFFYLNVEGIARALGKRSYEENGY